MHLGGPRSKNSIHFRDDLSEYSSPSSWGDGPGPLSLGDHRLSAEGLQARRTVGEALLKAQWERQVEADAEACTEACKCLGGLVCLSSGARNRAVRLCLEAFRRTPRAPSLVFTWAEVQSLILLPYEERGPYLLAITTFRLREDGSREWLLQAAGLRARGRWALEMMTAILRDRIAVRQGSNGACCASGRSSRLTTELFMDFVRVACEVARLQPSAEGMDRLVEALELLMESGQPKQQGGSSIVPDLHFQSPAVHFPLAALMRFRDSVRKAHTDFVEWLRFREAARLVRAPPGWDDELWRNRVLPFLWPKEPSLRDAMTSGYPAVVESQLANAADRCRRTLS